MLSEQQRRDAERAVHALIDRIEIGGLKGFSVAEITALKVVSRWRRLVSSRPEENQ